MYKCLIGKWHGLLLDIVIENFDTTIASILCYASEVWGFKRIMKKRKCKFNFVNISWERIEMPMGFAVHGEVGCFLYMLKHIINVSNIC